MHVHGEVFSSVSRMKDIARNEVEMYKHTLDYLRKERQRLQKLER